MDGNRMPIGRMVHMLSHQMKRQNPAGWCCEGLTPMQNHILGFILLESQHRDLYQKDVEEEFQIRKSTATGILKLMEKNGFICRESVKRDARLKKIVATDRAEGLKKELQEEIRQMEMCMTEGISGEELQICGRVLGRMLSNLSQQK